MEPKKRMPYEKRSTVFTTTAKQFRRVLYGALGIVISSYAVLFIMVITRHLDQTAQDDLRRAVSEGALGAGRNSRTLRRFGKAATRANGLGPNLVGMDRFHERWAAVARVLKLDESDPYKPKRRTQICSRPRYRSPPGPVTALASFPGSGNTWIRFLVQQATGYLTGSVYKDFSLKKNGFPAESVVNGSVILVKTHEWGTSVRAQYDKAVLLLRDPYGALLAEFNRRAGGHIGHAAPDKFHKGNAWKNFVVDHSKVWMENTLDWLQYDRPLLIVRYEKMMSDLPSELVRLLKFLDVNVSWPVFQCVVRNKDGFFRRAKRPLQFDLFDDELKKVVERYKAIVESAITLKERGIRFDINNFTVASSGELHANRSLSGSGESFLFGNHSAGKDIPLS